MIHLMLLRLVHMDDYALIMPMESLSYYDRIYHMILMILLSRFTFLTRDPLAT